MQLYVYGSNHGSKSQAFIVRSPNGALGQRFIVEGRRAGGASILWSIMGNCCPAAPVTVGVPSRNPVFTTFQACMASLEAHSKWVLRNYEA